MSALAESTPIIMLKLKDVQERVGLGSSTIYRRMAAGTFPRPANMGGSVRWYEHEINEYLLSLPRVKGAASHD